MAERLSKCYIVDMCTCVSICRYQFPGKHRKTGEAVMLKLSHGQKGINAEPTFAMLGSQDGLVCRLV